jgi:hypothetical protein
MKRIIPLTFVGLFFVAVVASCGSSKANCDAYGDVDTKTEHNDMAQK